MSWRLAGLQTAGIEGYITKPIRHGLLLQALAEFQKAPKTSVTLPENQFDTDDLIERLMGDEELARRLAAAFVDSMPEQLAALAAAVANSTLRRYEIWLR